MRDGYLDLLGDAPSGSSSLGQRLMTSRGLPVIYERIWRPVGVRILTGAIGPGDAMEEQMTDELLALEPGDVVLDVACGPGNISRRLRASVGEGGLVVGIDASATMLARAVQDTKAANVAYVRGDAQHLPFRDGSFDKVCCYAALYLMDEPFAAIDEMVRVLAPGGRVAVLTSCHRAPWPLRPVESLVTRPSGIRMFGSDDITGAFARAGLRDIRQFVTGFAQFVGARRP
jgi:SAM-dependent methyltransferase